MRPARPCWLSCRLAANAACAEPGSSCCSCGRRSAGLPAQGGADGQPDVRHHQGAVPQHTRPCGPGQGHRRPPGSSASQGGRPTLCTASPDVQPPAPDRLAPQLPFNIFWSTMFTMDAIDELAGDLLMPEGPYLTFQDLGVNPTKVRALLCKAGPRRPRPVPHPRLAHRCRAGCRWSTSGTTGRAATTLAPCPRRPPQAARASSRPGCLGRACYLSSEWQPRQTALCQAQLCMLPGQDKTRQLHHGPGWTSLPCSGAGSSGPAGPSRWPACEGLGNAAT